MQFTADHVVYYVKDLQRAKAFYSQTLKLPIIFDTPGFVKVGIGDFWLGLHPSEADGRDIGCGPMLYLRTGDLTATMESLRQAQVAIGKPQEVPSGTIVTIKDSEGNSLGLFQAKKMTGSAPGS
jgi:predicted enzyme related to lactoylglutathione lyase